MRLKREVVEMVADVALAAGIRVVPPGAADAERGLVDRERRDAGLLHLHPGGDPAEAGTDHDHLWSPGGTEQFLGGGLRRLGDQRPKSPRSMMWAAASTSAAGRGRGPNTPSNATRTTASISASPPASPKARARR